MRPSPGPHPAALDRAAVRAEMDQARADFRRLVTGAAPADLRRLSDGTRWTNQQLLFHMLFGYLITRALLILVRIFGLLPDAASRVFARLLDSAQRPFHLVNYLGSRAGARLIPPRPHAPGARPCHRGPAAAPGTRDRNRAAPRHALPGYLGSVLRQPDDPRRPLPLPHPAFPLPPAAAHPRPRARSRHRRARGSSRRKRPDYSNRAGSRPAPAEHPAPGREFRAPPATARQALARRTTRSAAASLGTAEIQRHRYQADLACRTSIVPPPSVTQEPSAAPPRRAFRSQREIIPAGGVS